MGTIYNNTVEAISVNNAIVANNTSNIDCPVAAAIDDFCIFNSEFEFFEEVSDDIINESITLSFEVENADQARWAIKTLKSTFGV